MLRLLRLFSDVRIEHKRVLIKIRFLARHAALGVTALVAAAASAPAQVPQTNVGIRLAVDSYDPAALGRRLTFRIEYYAGDRFGEGCAPVNAENVTIVDTLPEGVSLVSETTGTAVFDPTPRSVTWNLGTLDRCATFGNEIRATVAVDRSVPDGSFVTSTATITTSTPQTDPTDDAASTPFQAGFLSLQVSIPRSEISCGTTSALGPPDEKVYEGTPFGCGSEGNGEGLATVEGFTLSSDQIGGPGDVVTVHVGLGGSADGFFGDHGFASSGAADDLLVRVFNPNQYPVPLRLVEDVFGYAAADNELAHLPGHGGAKVFLPPFPGRIVPELQSQGLDQVSAAAGRATQAYSAHFDLCGPGTCGYAIQVGETLFPTPSGPDPELDPALLQPIGEFKGLLPSTDPCATGPVTPAGSTFEFGFGWNGHAEGSTVFLGDLDLFRSGYGLFAARGTLRIMLCATEAPAGPMTLEVVAHSPVDLMVTDPNGKKVGFDLARKRVIDQIPGASFTGHGSEPQTVRIPEPEAGDYEIAVQGTGTGPFTIDVKTLDSQGHVVDSVQFAGEASPGSAQTFPQHLSDDGSLGGSPPPGDTTAPAIQCGSPDTSWHASDVSLHCTAVDEGSGLADPQDASFLLSTAVPDGTETADAPTGSRNVCDQAGNCATVGPIGGNKVDKKAPTIAIGSPVAGQTYVIGQSVAADYGCADGGSGLAACAGPVPTGGDLDTSSTGTKAFVVEARDAVGHTARRSVGYAVRYAICPLYDQSKAHKLGSTVPIKLQLCSAGGGNVSTSSVVLHATGLARVGDDTSAPVEDAGNANPDDDFRYDATLGGTGGYVFNLSTKPLSSGIWVLSFTAAGDPASHGVQLQVK